jgi:hypothetical protein
MQFRARPARPENQRGMLAEYAMLPPCERMFYNCSPMASASPVAYRFAFRTTEAGHSYPMLVFDGQLRLHLPLTYFARAATKRLSASSVRVYLYALLPFFTFLENAPGSTGA